MKHSWTRIWMIVFSVVALIFVSLCVVAAAKYYSMMRTPVPAVVTQEPEFLPSADAALGEKIPCVIRVTAPWNAVPGELSVTPGEGTQLVADPVFQTEGYGWGTTKWVLTLDMQAYRTGDSGKGSVRFSFTVPGIEAKMYDLTIPVLHGKDDPGAKPPETLALAGEMAIPEKTRILWHVAIGLVGLILVVGVVLVLLDVFRRKNRVPPKTIWDLAMESIQNLRRERSAEKITAEDAVAALTDIVRHFLEERYAIRAERQTTAEFLREMDKASSVLPDADRKFLRGFLESSDMIKFAKMDAGNGVFEQSADRAEFLIQGAVPQSAHAAKGGSLS